MQQRSVEETQTYLRCCKKFKNFDQVDKAIKSTMQTFGFTQTSRSECIYRTQSNKVELWEFRVGDPQKNKGKSGGYRLICIYIKAENTIFLDYINKRDEHNKTKVKNAYEGYLKDLKIHLNKTYDNDMGK